MPHKLVSLRRQNVTNVKRWDIAKAFQTKQNQPKSEARQRARRAHYVDDPVESESEKQAPTTSDNSYDLFTVTGSGQNPIIVQVTVNQTPIQMELDTGASLSLINKQTFDVIADHRGKSQCT